MRLIISLDQSSLSLRVPCMFIHRLLLQKADINSYHIQIINLKQTTEEILKVVFDNVFFFQSQYRQHMHRLDSLKSTQRLHTSKPGLGAFII